jgi:hypothetical protein
MIMTTINTALLTPQVFFLHPIALDYSPCVLFASYHPTLLSLDSFRVVTLILIFSLLLYLFFHTPHLNFPLLNRSFY